LCKYKFARRRNRLTTHFSERIPVVKRRISVFWQRVACVSLKHTLETQKTRFILNDGILQGSGMWGHGLDGSGSGYGQVAGTCECGNEPSGSIKCGEFIDKLKIRLTSQEGLCSME